jgi:hypothetical protein
MRRTLKTDIAGEADFGGEICSRKLWDSQALD